LLLTIEPQPQSPEQIDARKIQAAQLVDETVKKEIISLEQSLEANQAKADAEYQKMQSMSKEEKEQAAAKAAAEKALAAKAKAAREKAEATSDVDEMLGELGSGKSAPKTHTSTSSGGASMAEISAYTAQVSGMIRSKLPAWDTYKGKRCSVVIHMKPDGKLTGTDSYNGDNDFCNYLKEGLNSIDEFPKVPNQSVYSIIKDASINFKP
ncbi:cell envelope integrity protein TolA, partial [Salmonella enterica subsp. enterica serovar Bredeney]|nr:cell envelope integrity protein TolA [Salmonella enterica subsp. enterica serovar Bredeney]